MEKLLYICTRFLIGVLRTSNLERFLQLDYSDVGWRIHSAPIEHPFSIHWNMLERRWKEAYRGHRLVIGVNAKNLSSDDCPKQGKKANPALNITPKTTTGMQCRDNGRRNDPGYNLWKRTKVGCHAESTKRQRAHPH